MLQGYEPQCTSYTVTNQPLSCLVPFPKVVDVEVFVGINVSKTYENFKKNWPHRPILIFPSLCRITRPQGHSDYLRSGNLSPWVVVDGWHIKSCFHDPMHVVTWCFLVFVATYTHHHWDIGSVTYTSVMGPCLNDCSSFPLRWGKHVEGKKCLNNLHSTHVSKFPGGKFSLPSWINHKWWSTKKAFSGFGYISE